MNDRIQSSLGRHVPRAASAPEEIRKMAEKAWHERNVLVIPLDDTDLIIDDIHRQACINVGNKLYGERKK